MPMDNMYTDYRDGQFIPQVTLTKREDNGHFTATSCGLEVTHHDSVEAVNRLTTLLQEGIAKGEIHPNM